MIDRRNDKPFLSTPMRCGKWICRKWPIPLPRCDFSTWWN